MGAAVRNRARERGEETREEIDWLRTFGWSDERIAVRLGLTVDVIQKHDREHPR